MSEHSPSPDRESGTGAEPGASRALPGGRSALGALWRQNFVKRVAVGVPALAVVLALIAVAPVRLLALVVAAAGVYGMFEYLRLLHADEGPRLPSPAVLTAAVAIGLGGVAGSAVALNAGLLLGTLIVVWRLWFSPREAGSDGLRDVGLALAGLLLVPWLLNHLGLLVQLPGGRGILAFVIVAGTLNDTLAYLVGTFFGRWPLMPAVSPNKTIEGAVGGVLGGALGGVIARVWLGAEPTALSLPALVLLGGLVAIAAQAGDLMESKLKRLTQADDSGHFLPGHGGLLDRVDAYLLVAPLAYYLLGALTG